MLSIAINRAEHECAAVIIKHNNMLKCNHKILINIMLCLLNSNGQSQITHVHIRDEHINCARMNKSKFRLLRKL